MEEDLMNAITTEQLEKKQQDKSNCLLVNTLDAEHFEKTKIPGSVNIPQSSDDFTSQVEQQAGGKEKEVVVYCASEACHSSDEAAEKLEKAGFTNVSDFAAGAEGWKNTGHELASA
jgi:rhodanese-related sulfurtransferase